MPFSMALSFGVLLQNKRTIVQTKYLYAIRLYLTWLLVHLCVRITMALFLWLKLGTALPTDTSIFHHKHNCTKL